MKVSTPSFPARRKTRPINIHLKCRTSKTNASLVTKLVLSAACCGLWEQTWLACRLCPR